MGSLIADGNAFARCAIREALAFERARGVIVVVARASDPPVVLVALNRRGWDLPGGGIEIEIGETSLSAAIREAHEEVGIDDLSFDWGLEPIMATRRTVAYVASAPKRASIKRNPKTGEFEHARAKWVSFDRAASMTRGDVRNALRHAKERVVHSGRAN